MKGPSDVEEVTMPDPMNKPRILVVDDDQGTRRTLTLILKRKGFEVATAGTAQEALRITDDGAFDVGLLDIRLPDMKGVELLQPFRHRHPDMDLIMVTGYASTETAMRALNEGATAYITKPLNMEEVLLEVEKVLEKQRLVAEKRAAEERIEHVNAVLRAIRAVNQLIVREDDRDRLIQGACESLIETRGYLSASLILRDQDGEVAHIAAAGLPGHTRELESLLNRGAWPVCARRALDQREVVITDASSASCGDCPLAETEGIAGGMAAPLEHGGKIHGVLVVTSGTAFAPQEELSLFREVADDIALGLHGIEIEEERARVTAEMEHQTTQLKWLASIQAVLSQAETAEGILTAAAMTIDLDQMPSRIALQFLETGEGGAATAFEPVAIWEDGVVVPDHPDLHTSREVVKDPLAELGLRSPDEPVFLSDVQDDPRADDQLRAFAERSGFRSALLMPLRSGGRWCGMVTFLWSEPHVFSPEERFYCRQVLEPLAAEVSSRRAHLARRKSEARYRALFNNATDALFIHDLEGRLLEVNQVACESLGYTCSELLGMTIEDLDAQERGSTVVDRVEDLRQRGHLVFETSHLRRDGSSVPVEVSSRLIDYEGRRAVLSAARDISARLDMERQLQRQERMAAVGQLAGGIAHDFRNFLTTIILYAGMPMSQPDLSPHVKDALQVIASEAEQASALVQQILDFSGRSSMETQPVDLVAFIEEAAHILRQTIPESIRVELDIEPEQSVVEADPTRIQQVLMNLALNARDAIAASRSADGGKLSIALSNAVVSSAEPPPISGMAPGEWVHLTVSDTGTGMTEEVKNRIFEPFFTTKERGEGTGLGLAQVYGIVQQHRGYIDVQTELGVGTAFHVYLPAHGGEAAQAAEQGDPEPRMLPQGQGELILLVEDQQNLREAGRETLTSLGYRVLTAADGREALEMLEGLQVDLLVTDVVMPELGGRALREELARFRPNLPVLAVTGYTMQEEVEELKSAGFFDVLQKPFDPSSLAQAVRRALDAR